VNSRRRGLQLWMLGAFAVALLLLLNACGSESGTDTDEITLSPTAPPREVAEVAGLAGVHSGEAEVSLLLNDLETEEPVSIYLLAGFEGLDEGSMPQSLSMDAKSNGELNRRSVDASASLSVLPDKAQIAYGNAERQKSYEIGTESLAALRSKFEQAHSEEGTGDLAACLQAFERFELTQLLRDPKIEERRQESDGTKVTVVVGELIISRLREFAVKLARNPACGAQMAALGLPPAPVLEMAKVDFKKGFGPHLTLAVDRHGVIRELSTRFECARLNGKVFELEFGFRMREVNRPIQVRAGESGKPFDRLLGELGTTEDAVLRAPSSVAVLAFLEGLSNILTGDPE